MWMRHAARAVAAAGIVGLTAGCAAKVKQSDFNNEVAKLRQEMQAGDQKNAARIDSTSQALAAQQHRTDALEQELKKFQSDYQVSIEEVKGKLKFDVPVYFDFNQSELRESDRPVLDRFAGVVKEYYPGALVTVEGFADPAGSEAYNLRLGQKRAEAVRGYLASTGGLATDELKAVSYGEVKSRQVVHGAHGPGDTGIENRRVTLVIDHASLGTDQAALP
jgi:outer membrane protein OmpA-like peptidoglycan-associated protein